MIATKYKVAAVAVLLLLTHASAGSVGWQLRAGVAAREEAEAVAEALERAKADATTARDAEAATQEVAKDVATATTRVEYVTREIIKEVPVHVTVEADRNCSVPDGFVRLHDAAATANPPVPYGPGESPDAASGVKLSTVLSTTVDNYGICHVLREQVIGWQSWYKRMVDNWDSGAS